MDGFKQDLTQKDESGTVFMMQLLMDGYCPIPERILTEEIMKKYLGVETECVGSGREAASFAVNRYKTGADGSVSPHIMIFGCSDFDGAQIDDFTRSQMWACPEHEEILKSCRYHVLISDMLSAGLRYKERADMLMDCMEAAVELFPECRAVYFQNSGKMFSADDIRGHNIPRDDRFIYFAVNVRFFNVQGTDDMIVDSLGMKTLFMPDLQFHFHGADPNHVVNHAYNLLSYMFENDNPIGNGHTVDGMENGRLSTDVQWVCSYEDSLIQPVREVIDVDMGKLASGERRPVPRQGGQI